jgi:hypothetical protein
LVELGECYQKSESIVFREIAGEMILVPIRQNVGDLESIYTLNETAAFMWGLIDGRRTVREIRDAVIAEYEVEEGEAEQDVLALLAQLASFGGVTRA